MKSSVLNVKTVLFVAALLFNFNCLFAVPVFFSGDKQIDKLAQLALDEVRKDVRSDGTFCAGAKWPAAWTRDMSYAIDLSLAFLFPEATEKSLSNRIENNQILQDTGSGGSYPVSTDRIVLGIALYDYAIVKNEPEYFKNVYNVLSYTIDYDYQVNFDPEKNLFRGETSFIDWREQSYPRWMNCSYIANSFASGTNALYYRCHQILTELAAKFDNGRETEWKEKTEKLKNAISKEFDSGDGYLVSYIIQDIYDYKPLVYETLGQSLCCLYGIAEPSVLEKAGISDFGVKVFDPDLKNVPSYHNDAVWPFVQSYYGLALKKAGYIEALNDEFCKMVSQAEKFGTFKENMVASSGTGDTQINSDRQLWSDAGFLSYIYKILLGIELSPEGVSFKPVNFLKNVSSYSAKNVTLYKGGTYNISVSGTGNNVKKLLVNGKEISSDSLLPLNSGVYNVEIYLSETSSGHKIEGVKRPVINVLNTVCVNEKGSISVKWRPKAFNHQKLYKNMTFVSEISKDLEFETKGSGILDVYTLLNEQNMPSRPVRAENSKNTILLEAEDAQIEGDVSFNKENNTIIKNSAELDLTTSNGIYLKSWGKAEGDRVTFSYNAKTSGEYVIDFRFQNGHGPVNTGEKCAIRAVCIDGKVVRRLPLPHQGNWSSWAWSVPVRVKLSKGKHTVSIIADEYCYSQHHVIVPVNLDLCRIARIN